MYQKLNSNKVTWPVAKSLWKSKVPLKAKILSWIAVRDELLTYEVRIVLKEGLPSF